MAVWWCSRRVSIYGRSPANKLVTRSLVRFDFSRIPTYNETWRSLATLPRPSPAESSSRVRTRLIKLPSHRTGYFLAIALVTALVKIPSRRRRISDRGFHDRGKIRRTLRVDLYASTRTSLRRTGDNIRNKLRSAFLKIGCPHGGIYASRAEKEIISRGWWVGRQAGKQPRQAGRPGIVTLGRPLKQRLLIYFTRIVNSIGPLAVALARSLFRGEPGSVSRAPFVTAFAIPLAGEEIKRGRKKNRYIYIVATERTRGGLAAEHQVAGGRKRNSRSKSAPSCVPSHDKHGRYIVARYIYEEPEL